MQENRTKRILVAAGAIAAVIIVGAIGTWLWIGRAGDTELENWIGQYIVEVLEHHVTPKVALTSLDYRRPRTVVVRDVRLLSDQVALLQLDRMLLDLAKVPHKGEPVVIERIELDKPRLQFVSRAGGGLVGWSNFVRPTAVKEPESIPPGRRLSDALEMRNFTIEDGEVVYDPRDGGEVMTLPGIDMRLDTPPEPSAARPGWYHIAGKLRRAQLFDIDINGRVNVDDGRLDLERLNISAALDEKRYGIFPPRAQALLAQHQVRGALAVQFAGSTKFPEWTGTSASLKAELTNGSFAYAGQQFVAPHLGLDAQLAEDELNAQYQADLVDTHASGRISLNLADESPVQFAMNVQTDDVERWLRLLPSDVVAMLQPRPLRGRLTLKVEGSAPRSDFARGTFHVDAELVDGTLALGDARFDTRRAMVKADVQAGRLDLMYDAELLDGRSSGSVRADLAGTQPTELSIALKDVNVAPLLDLIPADVRASIRPWPTRGRLSATLTTTGPLTDPGNINLRGTADLTDGALDWSGTSLDAHRVHLEATFANGALDLRFDSALALGSAAGRIEIGLGTRRPIRFTINLKEIEAGDLLALATTARSQSRDRDGALKDREPQVVGKRVTPSPSQGAGRGEGHSLGERLPTVAGRVSATVEGSMRLDDWQHGEIRARATLAGGTIGLGKLRVPFDRLDLDGTLARQSVAWNSHAEALGGRANAHGTLGLTPDGPLELSWRVDGVDLVALSEALMDHNTRIAGRLRSSGTLSARLRAWPASLDGNGELSVDHGQLVNIPLIGRLVDLFRAARIAGLGLVQQEDRVSMRFQLRPDHLAISEFDLTSMVVAARGEGRIYYDQRLDLLINAGPLERMQSLFGRIGELVGQVTDVLVTYHVTGILSDPHFTPRPLGMGSRR